MTIVLTGGGSGGHITPILAVAAELKRLAPDCKLVYVGQRGDSLIDVPAQDPHIDAVRTIRAGKFRRYYGSGFRQLLDVPTVAKNARDAVWVMIGLVQSWRLLRRERPAVVFTRGGFVSVPVALAAAWLGIPYVTHDSDLTPSLANRLIARWASRHAVALPKDLYSYPAAKTVMTGIPINQRYQPVDAAARLAFRRKLNLAADATVLFITGGGNGAQRLNMAAADMLKQLLPEFPNLIAVHAAGRPNLAAMRQYYARPEYAAVRQRVDLRDYVTDLYAYSGAADIVIARAGATNLAEFAAQHIACVIVPNPELSGGHQTKNAAALGEAGAIRVVSETELRTDPARLARTVADLLRQPNARQQLGAALGTFAVPDAAERLAMVLLEQVAKH